MKNGFFLVFSLLFLTGCSTSTSLSNLRTPASATLQPLDRQIELWYDVAYTCYGSAPSNSKAKTIVILSRGSADCAAALSLEIFYESGSWGGPLSPVYDEKKDAELSERCFFRGPNDPKVFDSEGYVFRVSNDWKEGVLEKKNAPTWRVSCREGRR